MAKQSSSTAETEARRQKLSGIIVVLLSIALGLAVVPAVHAVGLSIGAPILRWVRILGLALVAVAVMTRIETVQSHGRIYARVADGPAPLITLFRLMYGTGLALLSFCALFPPS